MKKVLLYKYRIFLNARAFYDFIFEIEFEGYAPVNWTRNYVAVAFSNKQKTILGFKVDWVTIDLSQYDILQKADKGWIRYSGGPDIDFVQFVKQKNETYSKEILWRWVIDYASLYDHPRSHMKALVDAALNMSVEVDKKKGVKIYKLAL